MRKETHTYCETCGVALCANQCFGSTTQKQILLNNVYLEIKHIFSTTAVAQLLGKFLFKSMKNFMLRNDVFLCGFFLLL